MQSTHERVEWAKRSRRLGIGLAASLALGLAATGAALAQAPSKPATAKPAKPSAPAKPSSPAAPAKPGKPAKAAETAKAAGTAKAPALAGTSKPGTSKPGKGKEASGRPGDASGPAAAPPPAMSSVRWTAATPDQMADLALERARGGGPDAIAGLVVAASLDDRAAFGKVRDGLRAIASSSSPVADDARWLALRATPSPAGAAWPGAAAVKYDGPADASGLVRSFAILGPFQDTGGGLTKREGPEAPGQSFGDMGARYAWGVYDVAWRRVLPAASTARGVPLDLYISPRNEACTYLASRVTLGTGGARPVLVHLAASGAARLTWDGVDVAASEDIHPRLVLDRMSARIDATPGEHLLSVKVCSGSVPDDGRVRVRFTDEQHQAISVASSSDLRGVAVPPPEAAPPKGAKGKPAAKGVTPVATSLQRAIDAGASPSVEQALIASIVRTLGGAEDGRSPRAPGLLDRVAREASVSPDVLAMAGWVSPFGANRSGWLNAAKARGDAEGDAATAALAPGPRAAPHRSGQPAACALALARAAPLRAATDPEARLIRAMADRQQGATGLSRSSLDQALALASELGDKTPIAVWLEIVGLANQDPLVEIKAQRRLAEIQAEARDAGYVRAHRALGGAELEIAAAKVLAEQTSAQDLIQIGKELLDAGRYAWAREVFYQATRVGPNRAAAFQGLAAARQAVQAAELRAGKPPSEDPRLAVAPLGRALDLEPGDARLKADLGFRLDAAQGGGSGVARGREKLRDEQYIVKPEVFLALAKNDPAKKGEIVDRQIHWVRAVTYHPDKRISQMMHYSREIVIEPRTQDDLVEKAIPSEGDETELLFARVHRKDGTTALPDEQSAGGRRPFVRWPDLHAGDVVEVAVRSWTSGPVGRRGDAPFYFIDYVGSIDTQPILYNEVVVDSAESAPLAIDVLNGKAERIDEKVENGRKITRYIWEHPVKIPDEPLAPKLSEVVPVVVGSTYAGWNEFREWYKGAVAGFTEPDDQVRRLAAELTRGKKSEQDKIKALFDFVADDIRYVNFVSGEWWLPNRPQELLARRQGDCDDKAILLISLLKSIGIEATEVLVQTRYTGQPSVLRSEKAAIPVFDHGIAYLPGKGGAPGIWLDATSPESRLGPLPSMDARTLAMFTHEGPAKIIETPASSPDDHGVDAEWTIKLQPSGAGELVATERHTGDSAFELRMNLKQADARAQWVEANIASGWFPSVEVKPEVDFKADLPRGATILKYEAKSDGLARREGVDLAVPLSEAMTLTSQLAPLVKRTLPVVLPPSLAPGHQTRVITIVAPPGYTFAELPPGGEEAGGEFGRAKLEFSKAPGKANAVVVKRSVVFDMSTIPVDKYARWRAWLQRTDGLMHRMVRLVPDAKSAPVADAAGPRAQAPKPPTPPAKRP